MKAKDIVFWANFMSHNSFGQLFRVTTWGESHGSAIGCVIDGCPPKIRFKRSEIQFYLDQRRPGQSSFTTQRREADLVKILSGVIAEGGSSSEDPYLLTTGTPIAMMIENEDCRSKDYAEISRVYRPGHADYTYDQKYGLRDVRGGGRASARETAMRVAAGALARKILPEVKIRGALIAMGPYEINRERWSWEAVSQNPFFCPDAEMVPIFAHYLDTVRKEGSSIGALIELHAENVPKGLGAPVYGKLDQELASFLMSINAVKSVEIGAGRDVVQLRGEENADQMVSDGEGGVSFLSNHAGGILGGISTGAPIIARFAVKPTPSIFRPQKTVDIDFTNQTIQTKGRHDPCVGIRAVPVGEAMLACLLADHYLRHRGQIGS